MSARRKVISTESLEERYARLLKRIAPAENARMRKLTGRNENTPDAHQGQINGRLGGRPPANQEGTTQ